MLDMIILPYCKVTHQREIIPDRKPSCKGYEKGEKKNVFILREKQ